MATLINVREMLEAHPVISHPFLRTFEEGRLTREQVRFWATQQFHFSVSLPSCLAALYARVPDNLWREKRALADFLNVEAWGSKETEGHSSHFLTLCKFLGLTLEELERTSAESYTSDYTGFRFSLCIKYPPSHGLAGIAVGNEALNLHIFRAYRDGIHLIPGLEQCPTSYFDAHLRDEQADYDAIARIFERVTVSSENRTDVRRSVEELLDRRVVFFDNLFHQLHRLENPQALLGQE